jgi:hypothetical protein
MTTRIGKAREKKRETLFLQLSTLRPPAWKTTEEALDYIGTEFRDWLIAIQDLASVGVPVPEMLAGDLALIAETLVDFLEEPRPIKGVTEAADYAGILAETAAALYRRWRDGGEDIPTDSGALHSLCPSTLPLLADAASFAAARLGSVYAVETGTSIRRDRQAKELYREQLRIENRIHELERVLS